MQTYMFPSLKESQIWTNKKIAKNFIFCFFRGKIGMILRRLESGVHHNFSQFIKCDIWCHLPRCLTLIGSCSEPKG